MPSVSFTCEFPIQGKARARSGRFGHYTPTKTVAFEKSVGFAARAAMGGTPPFEGGCAVDVFVLVKMPKSWTKKKKAEKISRIHTSKPDGDNALKAICDAMNRIVFKDDSQAGIQRIEMRWGETDRFTVEVRELEPV